MMKIKIKGMSNYILLLLLLGNSCMFNLEEERYSFDNFKNTPLWELAKSIRNDDADKVRELVRLNTLNIDFKEPNFHQTLLALAIQNNKRNAFIELLKAKADPNLLVGPVSDATPFIYAIRNVENCDLFFVENMLKYGADPNLKINPPQEGSFFENSFPLLAAIGNRKDDGRECLDLVKLLVNNGANINCCYYNPLTEMCEGVLNECILSNSMITLRYFVIDKKIAVPDSVFVEGSIDKTTQKIYSLTEILNTDDYQFEAENLSHLRKSRNEVLEYLESINRK